LIWKIFLIIGVGRAGKTTLSNMLKDKINSYNLIHSDSIKWAIIKALGKEDYYINNIDKQKEFEYSEYFQKTLLEFYNSLIRNDKQKYGYILETGQLYPKMIKEMINFDNTVVVCLGLGNLSSKDIVDLCIKYDTEESWTYGLSKEYLSQHANDWVCYNQIWMF